MSSTSEFPLKLKPLFSRGEYRYKVVYGGRGGLKSWSFARALLLLGTMAPLRVLCARETMESIGQSVHQLLRDQIPALGKSEFYDIQKTSISGRNGTLFSFAGLAHNVSNIKSLESYDVVWIEEADNVSKDSWETLIPTLRKKDSEIWVSFNPKLPTDEAYKRFVLAAAPPRAWVCQTSWRDNPWFPDVLREEMEYLKANDHDAYMHVYEGSTRSTVEGAIYKAEIMRCEAEGRITDVPYDASLPVRTFWDLGWSDLVCIWFVQCSGFKYRIIDYFEDRFQSSDYYLQVLQKKGYTYSQDTMLPAVTWPWDASTKMNRESTEQSIRGKGFTLHILDQSSRAGGIDAVRRMFPQFWFDGTKCVDGLAHLRRYQWGPVPASGQLKREPLHDISSHAADALRTMATAVRAPEAKEKRRIEMPEPYRPDVYAPFG